MKQVRFASKCLMSAFFVMAGVMHFVQPEFFLRIMPPYLPFHRELVLLSGAFEIILGICLWAPRVSKMAAWGIIALLLAVFPANIHLFLNQNLLPAPPLVHLLRLPMQGIMILWAYWHTRPENDTISSIH